MAVFFTVLIVRGFISGKVPAIFPATSNVFKLLALLSKAD